MPKTDSVAELRALAQPDVPSAWISNLWTKFNNQREKKLQDWKEVQEYIFATSTDTTSNKSLPWTHKTTTPKLTQIRDNLHSNYISSLFPNDKWLTWQAFSADAAKKKKAEVLTGYMENKTREGGFRNVVSHLLYDYIDTGNCFAMPTFETRYKTTPTERITDFVGPKAVRISPYDIVFNPTAASFEDTFKIVRSMTSLGAIRKMAETNPEDRMLAEYMDKRTKLSQMANGYSREDWMKASMYQVDGYGSLQEYYMTDNVELLEFFGDYHDSATGELRTNRLITIADRCCILRDEDIPTYGGSPAIRHAGWRFRPDNLWAMGPLDNLVGMQYLIDHYINMVSNALDLKVMPPKKIVGDVESFTWAPNAEIHLDENGDVVEMAQQFGDVYAALDFVERTENRMEMYAGAPREAMGIRTPGEKTAFEVQALENAAGRIFQEKIVQFEIFMEQVLNDMLEISHRNFDEVDVIRIIDNDLGAQQFKEITKEDLTANGILRPIGARHFAQKAQELQNLVGVFNSPIGQMIAPHTSAIGLTQFINDVIDLRGYNLFQPNIAVAEQQETQAIANQAQEDNIMKGQTSEEEMMAQMQQQQAQDKGQPK
jgi:hypothetical protein